MPKTIKHEIKFRHATVEIYIDASNHARWRIRHKNGRITATSGESFHGVRNAKRAALRMVASVQESEVC